MANESSILICGATGLVGSECLRLALAEPGFRRVVVVARRPVPAAAQVERLEQHVVDFEKLSSSPDAFRVDQIISALGTTRKKAGSKEGFRRVDFDYQLEIARMGRDQGARHFLLVSSMGASAASRIFYTRVKGELEDAVRELGYRAVTIVRPSLLRGERKEFRLGERVSEVFSFLLPVKYKPVSASDVAAALVQSALEDAPGCRVIESAQIPSLAREYRTSS